VGYDIHIVRTNNWLEAESDPICKEDVDRMIASDPELQWSTADYVDVREVGGIIKRYYAILWNRSPAFLWCKAEISCSNPTKQQIIKMIQVARTLGAKVIGDEQEEYELAKTTSDKEELMIRGID
jgi:hypothetical protein